MRARARGAARLAARDAASPAVTRTLPTAGGRSGVGRLQKTQMTRDNRITNRLVRRGKLPKSQLEIFPQ